MGNAAVESGGYQSGHGDASSYRHQQQVEQHHRMDSDSYPPPPTVSNPARCLHCQRLLVPPASSPHLFRCPCGEVVRTNSLGQVQPSSPQHITVPPSQQQHPGGDNRQQCQNCSTWLIPPPGAPRFRCTCGNVMINPVYNNGHGGGSAATSPSHAPSPSRGATVHARCPRCTQTLIAPPGHTRFRCPCGQMLALTQSRLRCPQCSVVLLPPPGAEQFRCPCGVVLCTPAAQLTMSAQTAADRSAPQAITRDQLDLSNLDHLQLGREANGSGSGSGADGSPTASGGGAGGSGSGGGGVGRLVSVRERMLNRLNHVWERAVDPKSLQVLWRLTSPPDKGDSASQAPPLLDESESRAWVRSLRDDGSIAWRPADKVDVYVQNPGGGKDYAQMPPATVQEAVIAASKLPFGQKLSWFRRQIDRLKVEWRHGHQTIRVKRSNLLETSTHAIMHIPPSSFHQASRRRVVVVASSLAHPSLCRCEDAS